MKMVTEKTVFFCLCFCHLVGVFGDELKSVMEGESVTLQSGVTDVTKMESAGLIKWTFGTNGSLIAKIRKDNSEIPDALDGRFRGRLKVDNKTGSLTITNTRTTDSGLYNVTISGTSSSPTHRFNVTVTGSSDPDSQTVLIGASAAGILLLVAAIVIFFIYRKHRKTDQQVEAKEEEVTYADTTFSKRNAPRVKQEEDVVYAGIVTRG